MVTPPPPKLKPPKDGDRHRGADIIVTQFVFGAIATFLVATRMYVRATMVRKVGWDDWLIVGAWISTVIGIAFNCVMVREGFGRHQFYLIKEPTHFVKGNHYQSIWPPTFFVSVILTRLSICFFLLRIFNVKTAWRWGLWALTGFILLTNIPSFLLVFLTCKPYEKTWNQKLPGTCWPASTTTAIGLYNGVISVMTDWVLASLPIAFLWDMQLSRKAKVWRMRAHEHGLLHGRYLHRADRYHQACHRARQDKRFQLDQHRPESLGRAGDSDRYYRCMRSRL